MIIRPRRSALFMPAPNQRALAKACTLAADALVLDLEDSVAPEQKAFAREQAVTALQANAYGNSECVIRINACGSDWWHDDVYAVARSNADAICLAKAETVEHIEMLVSCLQQSGAPATLPVWIMIESALGVVNVEQLACHPRVEVVVMGTTDLAKELRVAHTLDRSGLLYSLSKCILAARLGGADILDGVHLDLNDEHGFEHICRQGRDLGFDGKTLIHPKQLSAANRYFAPDESDVVYAKKVIAAWQQAQRDGKGVAVVDGKLVECMHVDEASRKLALVEGIKQLHNSSEE